MAEAKEKTGFNTTAVVLIALAILLFVYALSLFLQGGFLKSKDMEFQTKVMNSQDDVAVKHLAEQKAILDQGYRWVDQANGKVGVPLEDAKTLVVNKGL
jgi:hypothetical protein